MTHPNLQAAAAALAQARSTRTPCGRISERFDIQSLHDAYAVQELATQAALAAGRRLSGRKVGLTSLAVQQQLGVDQPDFGMLFADMECHDGQAIDSTRLIQPKAEGEIAFVLKHELAGPGVTVADVLRATEYVVPCFEIVDSRIADWKIKIQDTVADNASSALFVLGDAAVDPRRLDLGVVGMTLELNGEIAATGAGAAALGHPANAVAWLANTLGRLEVPLKAGEVILSGSLSTMLPVKAGDNLRISIGGIGSAGVRFV